MKKIRTPQEGAGAALSAGSTTTSNRTMQTPPEGVLSGFSATAEQFIAASQSAATKRAYASDLKHFFANGGAIPASPAVLAEYLAQCAEKLSVATLERRLTAIHKAHLENNLKSPARSETVKRVMYFRVRPAMVLRIFLQSQVAIRHSYRLPDNHQNGPIRGPVFIVFPTRP